MPSPIPAVIPAKKARIQFGALIDHAFYQDAQFVIVKKNKPFAVIVGMQAWERMQKARGPKARRTTFKSYRMGRMKGGLTREELYVDARPRLA